MAGVLLCGAGTHPGGSVIGVNGRNAAVEALKEAKRTVKKKAGWW
jgi:phytoene dehydrogenase-like protein